MSIRPTTAVRARTVSDDRLQPAVDAIRRIVRALRLAEQSTKARSGLSAAQLFVLAQLATTPAVSLTELARRTMTDRSSAAAVVERLLEAGLVVRDRATADRRRVTVRITTAGRWALRRAPEAPTTLLLAALREMSAREREALTGGLEALATAMGVADEPAGMLFEDSSPRLRRI